MMQRIATTLLLLLFFGVGQTLKSQSDTSRNTFVKDQYFKKLEQLSSPIPVFYNNAVRIEIMQLLKNQGQKTSEMIGKARYAIKQFGPYFDSLGLPPELAIISVVNSDFNSGYVEPYTGASGVWPLSYSTAKRYRLVTNSFVDQRRNYWLSAQVVASYLSDLERIYQDWHFTISAFYAGPINLNMAIRKAGNTLDYSLVHEALDQNQRTCLEKFMALWYVLNFHVEHKISESKFSLPMSDTICTSVALSLDYVADKLEVKKSIVSQLNPDLIEGIVPEIPNCTCFRIPSDKIDEYREKRGEIEIHSSDLDSTTPPPIPIEGEIIKTPTGVPVNVDVSSDPKLIYYTVKSGDNLGLLSKLFDCSINEIKKWNNMSGTMLYAGSKIKIYVPGDKIAEYKKINTMTAAQKQALARRK